MDIQLKTLLVLQLTEIAKQQQREMNEILAEAIAEYVERHTHETALRENIRAVIQQHKWLLHELNER